MALTGIILLFVFFVEVIRLIPFNARHTNHASSSIDRQLLSEHILPVLHYRVEYNSVSDSRVAMGTER